MSVERFDPTVVVYQELPSEGGHAGVVCTAKRLKAVPTPDGPGPSVYAVFVDTQRRTYITSSTYEPFVEPRFLRIDDGAVFESVPPVGAVDLSGVPINIGALPLCRAAA